ncbi:unnamed protein product [Ostreobium quekettii]|uniref:Deubiquitinating enzyme MINDY-3/4 conserved domain-containing protein n=1 Tax=Ostreobium quekettii TaxID=121088 RepID=A0A8S1IRW2_9CHLO|nr:unnamed protein product [Ostreobium quekettii]|eukprot:evm.model.scf_636EXC.10 EVM.evm.TU.scf_636EXC.10   scf_636EXC:58980-62626(+)
MAPITVLYLPRNESTFPTLILDQSHQIDLIATDVEDIDEASIDSALLAPKPRNVRRSVADVGTLELLTSEQIAAVRGILWGPGGHPPCTWKQGFFFSSTPGLGFGLVQSQGGPCGALAAVQGHILATCYNQNGFEAFGASSWDAPCALLESFLAILSFVRAGGATIIVGCPDDSTSGMTYQQLLRSATCWRVQSDISVREVLESRMPQYMERGGWGIVLFLFSVLLTKGIKQVQSEMDDPSSCLTGAHGYCSQELVNLLLCGQAATNVFDGNQEIEGQLLHGITSRPRVGLLTLLEWHRYVEVGQLLKSPRLPVWVVCSESHFTVLFATTKGQSLPLDLMYYDGLANQEAPIRLAVSQRNSGAPAVPEDRTRCEGTTPPPLECVIHTKWPNSRVTWIGSDPLL